METQRDMDKTSNEACLAVETRVRAIIGTISQRFSDEPSVLEPLAESQKEFEVYCARHLDLISASSTGTVSPLLRNATLEMLLLQREAVLASFLSDVAPDLVL